MKQVTDGQYHVVIWNDTPYYDDIYNKTLTRVPVDYEKAVEIAKEALKSIDLFGRERIFLTKV